MAGEKRDKRQQNRDIGRQDQEQERRNPGQRDEPQRQDQDDLTDDRE